MAGVATGSGYAASQISEVASIWAQTGLSGLVGTMSLRQTV